MTTTQLNRLLKLAAFLRTVPRKRFKMSAWATGPLNECGTAGCALGWGSVLFKKVAEPRLRLIRDTLWSPGDLLPECGGRTYLGAAMVFFGIDHEDAFSLFGNHEDNTNATPKKIAGKIEKFVKGPSK